MRALGFILILVSITWVSPEDASADPETISSNEGTTSADEISDTTDPPEEPDVESSSKGSEPSEEASDPESFTEAPSTVLSEETTEEPQEEPDNEYSTSPMPDETTSNEAPIIRRRPGRKNCTKNKLKPTSKPQTENDLIQFFDILLRSYGFSSADWMDYGNFCGPNLGEVPDDLVAIDDCDNCCRIHDDCYVKVGKLGGGSCFPYTKRYKYHFDHEKFRITCMDKRGSCPYETCKCDSTILKCLRHFSTILKVCDLNGNDI